jgi:hypothetical protein
MRATKIDANQPEIVKLCAGCKRSISPTRMYCSRLCAGRAVGKNGSARYREISYPHSCANCGLVWADYYKSRKFCSKRCFGEYRTKSCWVSPLRGQKTSLEKRAKLSAATKDFMSKYGSRRDKNHPAIVDAFRRLGCDVIDMAELGNGCPDAAIYCRGAWHVIEIKNPESRYGKRGLSRMQRKWAASANAPVYVIRTIDQVVRFVNGDTNGMRHIVESTEQALKIITET